MRVTLLFSFLAVVGHELQTSRNRIPRFSFVDYEARILISPILGVGRTAYGKP